ncbi:MAG: EAL domain-containing protein [Lachnospiraceae bacterium]|nr:EAL domain-containing protein [Lachnospiraceae bacterium]
MNGSPEVTKGKYGRQFAKNATGGAFIFRADDSHEILYANQNLIRMFECDDYDDFISYTGGSFFGMIHTPEPEIMQREIELRMADSTDNSGYVFFNIITKGGIVRRVVNHWIVIHDDEDGDLFYAYLFMHRLENQGSDYDTVTGLLGKQKFTRYAIDINNKYHADDNAPYAIIFVNLVGFKLLNIERGVAEGDECLKALGKALTKAYDYAFVARLSSDHFVVFSKYEDVHEKTEKAMQMFYDSYGYKTNVICKFGIYRFNLGPGFDAESAISFAKIACDHIKRNKNDDIAEYTGELASKLHATEYVIEHIDEALENGWIKVYFQPVIRTLTGRLCSMESLVRWIDPVIGFLPPDQFIGTLEDERCIHKLDSFVVDSVCSCLRERMDAGKPVVPVSINFSRLDFILCDMLNVVETAVSKYSIPRDYLHIEITESMIASDENLMRKVINDFEKAGYEIWMDDFGSGYSSLTVLKGYSFDMLKMDMRFLYPFTDKSKSILRSVVTMAKDIGMKTLAEGVETKDQLDFLKEIGCGRIQGYYYGKPEPVEDVFEHLKEKDIPIETIEWNEFYNIAGFNAICTDSPLEIIEDDGENFKTLFMNKSYRDQVFDRDHDLEEIDRLIYHTGTPLLRKYRDFADVAERTGKAETFYYTGGGRYYRLTIQAIAKHEGHYIIKGTISNISSDTRSNERKRLDSMLKEMNLLFESVQEVNLSKNTIIPLLGRYMYINHDIEEYNDLQRSIKFFSNMVVLPEERERCAAFLKSADLAERVESTGTGYIADVFHLKQEDGNYRRCETYIMMIPGTDGNEFLFCVKPCIEPSS